MSSSLIPTVHLSPIAGIRTLSLMGSFVGAKAYETLDCPLVLEGPAFLAGREPCKMSK